MISFCGPCRLNVESMNLSTVLALLRKGPYLKKSVLKEKTFEHTLIFFCSLQYLLYCYI